MKLSKVLGVAALAATTIVHAGQPPLLQGEPWPMKDGQFLSGKAVVYASVAWDGTPLLGCIEQSSGNEAMDRAALRLMAAQHVAALPGGELPGPYDTHVSMNFDAREGESKMTPLPGRPTHACEAAELPSVPAAMRRRQLEAAHTIEITMTPDGLVPGTHAAWPRDESGKLINDDVYVVSIVNAGHFDEAMRSVDTKGPPMRHPEFVLEAADVTRNLTIDDPADPRHVTGIVVRFSVPAALDGSTIPPFDKDAPAAKVATRLQACGIMADLAFMMSKDHRAGVSQASAVARAKSHAPGLLPEMIDKVGGIIFQRPAMSALDDMVHRKDTLLFCAAALAPPKR